MIDFLRHAKLLYPCMHACYSSMVTSCMLPTEQAEKKEAAKRRGKADFYTTDAKFDEKFQLGYQMSDKKPWYAHKPSNIESELDNAAKHGTSTSPAHKAGIVKIKPHEAGKRQLAQAPGQPQPDVGSLSKKGHLSEVMSVGGGGDAAHNSSSSNSSNSSDSDSDSDSSPSSRHDRKLKQQRRSRSHSKNSKNKRARGKDKRSNSSKHKRRRAKESRPSTAKSIEQLREERIEREQLERTRERHVLLGAMSNVQDVVCISIVEDSNLHGNYAIGNFNMASNNSDASM
eukprot:365255-Chlamydomonas_euryale.AAC.34